MANVGLKYNILAMAILYLSPPENSSPHSFTALNPSLPCLSSK